MRRQEKLCYLSCHGVQRSTQGGARGIIEECRKSTEARSIRKGTLGCVQLVKERDGENMEARLHRTQKAGQIQSRFMVV